MLQKFFSENRLDVLIFQDYNKGFLHGAWISKIIKLASDAGIKTAVDPKKENFFEYSGVDLFKTNLREAIQAIEFRYKDLSDLSSLSKILRDKLLCNKLMITLASEGIWIDNGTTAERHKTKARKVADVSGAGDTVICLAAICQACSLSDLFMAACCNAGGGQVCEKFGVVPLKKEELIHELLD
jgi:rfaE bifunctional protein kinase chain/domain